MNLWLIGAGPMAQEYARVLNALRTPFEVIGRGDKSAAEFSRVIGKEVRKGGLTAALAAGEVPDCAIVAVGVEYLAESTEALVRAGTRRVLVEKPGGINVAQLERLEKIVSDSQATVWLAYNRRFFASTLYTERAIAEDGGVTSVHFEFTEWSHVIGQLTKGPGVKERWMLANSTHVVDLAFYLGGIPLDWKTWIAGSLDWHPTAARFCGAGITDRGALLSYTADWEAPGRWGLEILTRRRRLVLRPMEHLQVVEVGSVNVDPVLLDDQQDREFKPGVYHQTLAFISGETTRLCTLREQVRNAKLYSEMAGYDTPSLHNNAIQ